MSVVTKDKQTIVREVKVILDQNQNSEELLNDGDIDQLTTDELIGQLIGMALERVYTLAPMGILADVAKEYEGVTWDNDCDKYAQVADVPDDYLRLVYVKLQGWDKGVTSFVEEEDALYSEYRSSYAGIRPTADDPGVAIVYSEEDGGLKIQCYPKTGKNGVVKYVSKSITEDKNGEYGISGLAYQGFLYTVANLFYVSLGLDNMAKMMSDEASQALRLNKKEE